MASAATHPIYSKMLSLNPDIDKNYAFAVSNEIYNCHKKTGIDKFLLVALFNLESSLDYKQKNCKTALLSENTINNIINQIDIKPSKIKSIRKKLKNFLVTACVDFGFGQINIKTALKYKECSNIEKLSNDWRYNLNCSCTLLSEIKSNFGKAEPKTYWSRYNTSNPFKRKAYEELVLQYYPKFKMKE